MICRVKSAFIGFSAFFTAMVAAPTFAADLSIVTDVAKPGDGCGAPITVSLSGTIRKGDVEQLRRLLQGHLLDSKIRRPGASARLTLDSPGGNLTEGIALANFVYENAIRTHVGAGSSCLSACALVFMGGSTVSTDGEHLSLRELDTNGRLGFHAPSLPDEMLDAIDGSREARQFEQVLVKAAREFVGLFRNHNWAQSLVEASLSKTEPGAFSYVQTVDDAGRWRIELANQRKLRVARNKPAYTLYQSLGASRAGNQAFCHNSESWAGDYAAADIYSGKTPYAQELMRASLPEARIRLNDIYARFAPTQIEGYRETILTYEPSDGYEITCREASDEDGRIVSAFWPGDGVESRSGLSTVDGQGIALIPVDRIRAWHALPPDTPITRIDEAIAETGIFITVAPEEDTQPFVVETRTAKWNHNGSEMELRLKRFQTGRTDVAISYSQPKESLKKLGFEPGRVLFKGQLVSGSLRGTAYVFRNGCDPIPYDVAGPFDPKKSAFTLFGAAPSQSGDRCRPTGLTFDSSAAALAFDQQGIPDFEREGQTQKVVVACPVVPSD